MIAAIMQPYLFPYIGYFQLIKAVDKFVFYDDVNYINKGWINRNRILLNGNSYTFTVPCLEASQNKLINQIFYRRDSKEIENLLKTIESAYKKATYFKEVFALITEVFCIKSDNLADLSSQSILGVCNYLGLERMFINSSEEFSQTRGLAKADRLISISKLMQCNNYINAVGGIELYQKDYFSDNDIKLEFLKTNLNSYKQFNTNFLPGLSIIDILMFNSVEEVNCMLDNYELV